MKPNARRWLLAGILVLAAVLRLADLEGRGLWCDELLSVQRASLTLGGLIEALKKVEHVPLYEVCLRLWLKLGRSDSMRVFAESRFDFHIRCLSSILGVLTILMVYPTSKRLYGGKAALLIAFLLAISPFHVFWSRIARPYALLPLVVWLATYLLVLALEQNTFWRWVAYSVAMALTLYTHYFACFVFVAQSIFFVLMKAQHRKLSLAKWVGVQALILAAFLPWLIVNLGTAVEASTVQVYYASQAGLVFKLIYFLFVFSVGWTVHPLNLPIVLPAAVVYGWLFLRGVREILARSDVEAWLPIPYFALPLLVGIFVPACDPKHAIGIYPAYSMVIALGLLSVRVRWQQALGLAAVVALSAASLFNYFTNRQYGDADLVIPWREMVKRVESGAQPGDGIVLGYDPEHFRWYYKGSLPTYDLSRESYAAQLAELARRHKRLWLIVHLDDHREQVEAWLNAHGRILDQQPYQLEEHTLKGLREGLRHIHKYRSYMYCLYLFGPIRLGGDLSPTI